MTIEESKEYLPILTQSLRVDVIVPFDCYLHFQANEKYLHFLKAGNPFPADKLQKFKSFKVAKLYIKKIDEPAYAEYLRQALEGPEGKILLEEILEKQKSEGPVEGIPEGFKLPEESQQDDVIKVTGKIEEQNDDKVEVKGNVDPEVVEEKNIGKVLEEDDIISVLRQNVENLESELKFKSELTTPEITTIKDATDKISEEIIKVEGLAESNSDESKNIINGVTQHIIEEVNRITGVANQHDDKKSSFVRTMIEELKKELKEYVDTPSEKRSTKKMKDNIWRIQQLTNSNKNGLVADNMSHLVAGLENLLGSKIVLASTVSKQGEQQVVGMVNEAFYQAKQFKEKLSKELPAGSPLHASMNAMLEQLNTASTLGLAAAGLSADQMPSYASSTVGASSPFVSPKEKEEKKISHTIHPDLKQESKINPDDPTLEEQLSALKSENNVLQVQLQDSKALLETNHKKITDLESLMLENGNYVQALEKESEENKKNLFKAQEQIQKCETDNANLVASGSDIDRILIQNKAEIQARNEDIRMLKTQIEFLQKDLKAFQEKYKEAGIDPQIMNMPIEKLPFQPELVALLKEKEKRSQIKQPSF